MYREAEGPWELVVVLVSPLSLLRLFSNRFISVTVSALALAWSPAGASSMDFRMTF